MKTANELQDVTTVARIALAYHDGEGVHAYIKRLREADPMELVEIERKGIDSTFLVDLAAGLGLPRSRVFQILGAPKSTAARKTATGSRIDGLAGWAAIGMIKLIGEAQDLVDRSTSTGADTFDTLKWMGQWLERPQPALGGRLPADFLATPTGAQVVSKVLGAIGSDTYL